MKIVYGDRASGKTTQAIIESSKTGRVILVPTTLRVIEVESMAKRLGVKIPKPITQFDLKHGGVKGSLIVDDALEVLNIMLNNRIKYATISTEGESQSKIGFIKRCKLWFKTYFNKKR